MALNYQTIKLSKGRHATAEDGACVMELASMLAGEPFTDHPQSVCPVIGSFLRAYNDSIDDQRRQDLYAYASRVVGCRADGEVERARAEHLAAWRLEMLRRRPRFGRRPSALRLFGWWRYQIDLLGADAVRAIRAHTEETHASVLALVEELLALGHTKRRQRPSTISSADASGTLEGRMRERTGGRSASSSLWLDGFVLRPPA